MEKNQPYRLQVPAGQPQNAAQAVDYLIASALSMSASDIHVGVNHTDIVPQPYIIRLRCHGKLRLVRMNFAGSFYREMVARIKVLAALDTNEVGVPLDGQINVIAPEGPIVLRVSIVPSHEGFELVIRIQRGKGRDLSIESLEMNDVMQDQMNKLIMQKSGLIVLNGPAGSGKTSTIYAVLKTLASPGRKILTAEDPIETRLPFVSHTQVTPKTNFNSLGRAFMRQDSDVIFIGEVRDQESAEAAIQLAQTGHLVLTTLHTRDAIGVISRLEAFEIHSNFIASALIASLSQRLIPRICPHCRVPRALDPRTMAHLQSIAPVPRSGQIYDAGPGCDKCIGGIVGRKAIFELFIVDADISDMMNRRCSRLEILNVARQKGMTTLVEDIVANLYNGHTDINSVKDYLYGPGYDRSTPSKVA